MLFLLDYLNSSVFHVDFMFLNCVEIEKNVFKIFWLLANPCLEGVLENISIEVYFVETYIILGSESTTVKVKSVQCVVVSIL